MMIKIGKHYFILRSERIDQFRHKRYCDPSVEKSRHVVLMGKAVEQKGSEVKLLLNGNNGFERDGKSYVFSVGDFLLAPKSSEYRTLEDHGLPKSPLGVWK